MKKIDIYEELKSNDYPGRGIVIGKSADGKSAVTAYFITVSYTHLDVYKRQHLYQFSLCR